MEKVTQFLERYVQWIVLGLMLVFLGYMAYANWVDPKPLAKIANQTVEPEQINDKIADKSKAIQNEMNRDAPQVTVGDHRDILIKKTGGQDPRSLAVATPLPVWAIAGQGAKQIVDDSSLNVPANATYAIAGVAVPPKPGSGESSTGRMLARLEDKEALDAAKGGAAGGDAPAAATTQPKKTKTPAGGAGAGGAVAAGKENVKTRDVDWITHKVVIDSTELEAAFRAAYKVKEDAELPPDLTITRILKVEMVRQEQLPDGTWSKAETPVPPLEMYKMRPLPPQLATTKDQLQAAYEYLDWAVTHADYIATPAFYTAEKGDQWRAPGTEKQPGNNPAVPTVVPTVPNAPFDPAHPPKNRKLTPEEKKMVADYKKATKGAKVGPGGFPVGPGMLPPAAPRGGKVRPYFQTTAPPRSGQRSPYPTMPGGYPNPYGRPGMMPPGMVPPGYNPYNRMMPPGYGRNPGMPMPIPQPGVGTIPGMTQGGGIIDVFNLTDDVTIWAHDETVKPGKTYRYRIRYYLQNPLFGQGPNIQTDPKNKQILWLLSDWSDWSEAIHVSERVNFWLAQMTQTTAKFDVFEWKNDAWVSRVRSVTPGDQIPGTNWTLADIRRDSKGQYVLLVNDAGVVERRDLKKDQESSEYQEMKDQTAGGATGTGTTR